MTKENNLSLSEQFSNITKGFEELNQISNLRVDIKARLSHELAIQSVQLTGLVIQTIEKLEASLVSLQGACHEES